jgi:hypothetical protein
MANDFTKMDQGIAALLYHRRRPCANPGRGIMMNKLWAIGVVAKARGVGSWRID